MSDSVEQVGYTLVGGCLAGARSVRSVCRTSWRYLVGVCDWF